MDEKFSEILMKVNPDILESQSSDLIDDGLLDSLGIMMLIANLESSYAIEFDPDEIIPENFTSVESIWHLLLKYIGNGK